QPLILVEAKVGVQQVITVHRAIATLQVFFIGQGRLVSEESRETKRKRIQVLLKAFAVFFAQAVGAEVDVDVEIGDGSAEHAAVLAVDSASVGVQFDELLVE